MLASPDSEEILGFQLDDFLEVVVVEQPNWSEMAPLAGISQDDVTRARERVGDTRWREAVISSTLRDLFTESELTSA